MTPSVEVIRSVHLPPELLCMILEYAAWNLSKSRQLKLTLVSKAAHHWVSRIFYHTLFFGYTRNTSQIDDLIAIWTSSPPSFASKVRELYLIGNANRHVKPLLKMFPLLHRVYLELFMQEETIIPALLTRPLTHLTLEGTAHRLLFAPLLVSSSGLQSQPQCYPSLSKLTHMSLVLVEEFEFFFQNLELFLSLTHLALWIFIDQVAWNHELIAKWAPRLTVILVEFDTSDMVKTAEEAYADIPNVVFFNWLPWNVQDGFWVERDANVEQWVLEASWIEEEVWQRAESIATSRRGLIRDKE